ncbi:hypothetical protein RUM43_002486 [Polyplax serrata]|uniref:Serine protease K12H4.7 n=1 Tax=Polyplax serrata TaxID=468196 RepID=A0AAN8S978_POLSC
MFLNGICNHSWRIFHRGRSRYGNLHEPNGDIRHVPEEQYFEQKLDHFDPSSSATWQQRYFVNDTHYKPGGPVFLMIGGEGEASPKWMVEGTWLKYAQRYNAYCVQVEHRFYGKSHPTDDLSVKNLAYLNSEQALADLANFITSFNLKLNQYPNPKWIAMGGSYPGSLAAWMRLKYPHLVQGAVSTSGPLLALLDFKEYFEVVKDSLATYNTSCVSAIAAGTEQLDSFLNHPLGQQKIFKIFKLCDPIEFNNENDFSNLHESLASNFAGVVQYNKDNRHEKEPKKPEITIDYVCDIMLNETLGIELVRLATVNEVLLKKNNETCLDFKYDKMIKEMRATDWNSEVAEGMRQWTYQTCTEFGFYQTSSSNSTQAMFGNKFPTEFFTKQCTDIFGSKFSDRLATEGIKRTNIMYGGLDDRADNVVYVHGSIDPWHVLGITKTLREDAPAIYIEGTAHCANMYPPSPKDVPQLVNARNKIEDLIGEWLAK